MRFLKMKKLVFKTSGWLSLLIMTLFIIGCASEPIKVDLPATHPANPGAQEAKFAPPPNPFQEDVTALKKDSTPDSMMKHKTHGESNMQHMDHNMGTEKKSPPDSESTKKSGHGEDDNQHKGHSQ